MAPILYGIDISPPTRSVLLALKALDINYEYKQIDFYKGEHRTPEFLKLNPQHTIPTLVDDDAVIWDSHAIIAYLVEKYGKDGSLYPKDLVKRAQIDQRLHFDSGNIFPLVRRIVLGIKAHQKIIPECLDLAKEQYDFCEKFLEGNDWMCGSTMTIADLSLFPTITSLAKLAPYDASSLVNLTNWIKRCETLPFAAVNKKGLDDVDVQLVRKLSSNN